MPYTSSGSYIRNPAAYAAASGGSGMYTGSGAAIRNSSAYMSACESSSESSYSSPSSSNSSSSYGSSYTPSHSAAPDGVSSKASSYGYAEIATSQKSMRSFTRTSEASGSKERVNYYPSTGTVGTSLDHPKSGKTQLFRKNVSSAGLSDILADPRSHTGKGYYTRSGGGGKATSSSKSKAKSSRSTPY